MIKKKIDSASFWIWVRLEFQKACEKNPNFTLRSFAQFLGVSHSSLSRIMTGRQKASPETIKRIALRLGLSESQIQSRFMKEKALKGDRPQFRTLKLDTFSKVWEWHHYALLELVSARDFKSDSAWIAKMLRIPVEQVDAAKKQLVDAGLLEIRKNGKLKVVYKNTTAGGEGALSHEAIKAGQRESLALASKALDLEPEFGKKFSGATTLILDPDQLPEAFEKIKQFRRDLAGFFSSGQNKRQVYHLVISLFPLSARTDEIA